MLPLAMGSLSMELLSAARAWQTHEIPWSQDKERLSNLFAKEQEDTVISMLTSGTHLMWPICLSWSWSGNGRNRQEGVTNCDKKSDTSTCKIMQDTCLTWSKKNTTMVMITRSAYDITQSPTQKSETENHTSNWAKTCQNGNMSGKILAGSFPYTK